MLPGALRSHNHAYAHTEQCIECCTSDACNHKGCGGLDYPGRRGPLCFNCPQSLDPSTCSSVKVCDENEICHLREEVEFGDSIFVQSCSQKHICNSGSPDIFGKRLVERCLRCCDSDLCNLGCTDSFLSTTSTLTTTTTTLTTPTTPSSTTTSLKYSSPFDCWEVFHNGYNTTGIYQIYPWGTSGKSIDALCNMDVEPKGWTVFQWRYPWTENFTRNWKEYKNGFGNVSSEFWLGNEILHLLTTPHRTLFYIGITSTYGGSWYERFDNMKIASEAQKYTITLGRASGTAGDQSTNKSSYHSGTMDGMPFSTYDRDNDLSSTYCASVHQGGWWYNNCYNVFLNGPKSDCYYQDVLTFSSVNSSILMITRM
ncbi:fibrinogen-like protein 1 isoform X1 [Saccostrea cucullata]|uniref:fibrinogen-like protein 1 isoform X1 n=1 Tax=Saccostrea cuccullata TaxID=36930 RepID=UPI002ED14F72